MKFLKLSLCFFASMVLLSSCKKGIGELVDNNTKVEFKLDGVTRKNSGDINIQAFYFRKEKFFQLLANMGSDNISLTIMQNFKGAGTYTAEAEEVLFTYSTTNDQNSIDYLGTSGTIKITFFSETRIKGEFQCLLEVPFSAPLLKKTITVGTFDCKVTSLAEAPQSSITITKLQH